MLRMGPLPLPQGEREICNGKQGPSPSSQPPGGMDGGHAAGQVAVFRALEAGGLDALDKRVLRRKAAAAFDETLAGLAIPRHQRSALPHHPAGLETVES